MFVVGGRITLLMNVCCWWENYSVNECLLFVGELQSSVL